MSRLFALSIAGLLATVGAAAQLTDQQVARAIERAGKIPDRSVCVGDGRPGQFNVCVQGPEQRIASAAFLAKQARRSLRPNDISDDMKALTWVVFALPNAPALVGGRYVRAPSAEKLRLHVGDSAASVIDPLGFTATTYSWDNPVGVTLTAQGITATFDVQGLAPGPVDILVTTAEGVERRYVLTSSARDRIR